MNDSAFDKGGLSASFDPYKKFLRALKKILEHLEKKVSCNFVCFRPKLATLPAS